MRIIELEVPHDVSGPVGEDTGTSKCTLHIINSAGKSSNDYFKEISQSILLAVNGEIERAETCIKLFIKEMLLMVWLWWINDSHPPNHNTFAHWSGEETSIAIHCFRDNFAFVCGHCLQGSNIPGPALEPRTRVDISH